MMTNIKVFFQTLAIFLGLTLLERTILPALPHYTIVASALIPWVIWQALHQVNLTTSLIKTLPLIFFIEMISNYTFGMYLWASLIIIIAIFWLRSRLLKQVTFLTTFIIVGLADILASGIILMWLMITNQVIVWQWGWSSLTWLIITVGLAVISQLSPRRIETLAS